MSISWGGIQFDGPYSLENYIPQRGAAIYSIMFKPDPLWKPNTYQIIYFGETGSIADRGFPWNHHAAASWIRSAQSKQNLFIGFYYTPGLSDFQRRQVEQALINQYQPACNAC